MKTQDFAKTGLFGHWRVRMGLLRFDWIFRDDCSFIGRLSVFGIPMMRLNGTWSIEGDKLVSIYHLDGRKDTDTLLEVAQDYFILMTSSGTRRKWERVDAKPVA